MIVAQNKYISSKRASRASGYSQDYVGQLVRMGKLPATKVGKSWFVDESALLALVNGSRRIDSPARGLAELSVRASRTYSSQVTAGIQYPSTWSPVLYQHDDAPLYPVSDIRDTAENMTFGELSAQSGNAGKRESLPSGRPQRPSHGIELVGATSIDGVRFTTLPNITNDYAPISLKSVTGLRDTTKTFQLGAYTRSTIKVLSLSILIFLIPLVG